jgi:hypothetical protein
MRLYSPTTTHTPEDTSRLENLELILNSARLTVNILYKKPYCIKQLGFILPKYRERIEER